MFSTTKAYRFLNLVTSLPLIRSYFSFLMSKDVVTLPRVFVLEKGITKNFIFLKGSSLSVRLFYPHLCM